MGILELLNRVFRVRCSILILLGLASTGTAYAAPVPSMPLPGMATYRTACAACHDFPEQSRAPAKATLTEMSSAFIDYALTKGKMREQGSALTESARKELVEYLTYGAARVDDSWVGRMKCAPSRERVIIPSDAAPTTFGFDVRNTRSVTGEEAGISGKQLDRLQLKWAVGFPGVTMMRGQPAVAGDSIFLPVAEMGMLFSFDISDKSNPCIQWVYKSSSGAPLRSSAAFGMLENGRAVIALGGVDATGYLIDAETGKEIWSKDLAFYSYSTITATPRVLRDRIIFAVSQFEILHAANNDVECCTNHGVLVSLSPEDGELQWRYDTMPDAAPVRDRGDGKPLLGPSGAPIWNSPLVDEGRGLIYFGTGEANSPPAHENTDAIIAVSLKTGRQMWAFQAMASDIFNSGCGVDPSPGLLNCVPADETVYRDADFGASMILAKLADGNEILLAGQKSGTVWALDPDSGNIKWTKSLGHGWYNGGIHWGMAYGNDTIYVPIAKFAPPVREDRPVGVYALDANDGHIKWQFATHPDCDNGRRDKISTCEIHYGISAAPTLLDDRLIVGGLDGKIYILNSETGNQVWSYDTVRNYSSLNEISTKGGSIDGPPVIIKNGLVMLHSGYGMFGQEPGNAYLAFTVD